jgi:hypothetical protein
METFCAIFPCYGRFFADFSTVWKNISRFFHAMEKLSFWAVSGCF